MVATGAGVYSAIIRRFGTLGLNTLDWFVIGAYLLGMLTLAVMVGRRQSNSRDYYLGGGLPAPALAVSVIATQCSTNSLLGAPAFVGFAAGGGLLWLQYELAVPLAMLALAFVFPAVFRGRHISVYGYLEARLGTGARRLAAGCFLLFRGVATGVTVYGVASVLSLITGLSYSYAVLLLMGVTIAYDVLGGMRAVVISDVIQMLLLTAAVVIALIWLWPGLTTHWQDLAGRTDPISMDWGISGNGNFGFWPMLFGGLFLYAAYYGCDQSQAQRLLANRDEAGLRTSLLLNGTLRFPLVLAYCLLGLGLAAYALDHPALIGELPKTAEGHPNLNLVFPAFVLREFAPGLAGLAIVGLFAAAMSSIDSALNSLSASTLQDVWRAGDGRTTKQTFRLSKVLTLVWGLAAVVFSYSVEHIASTILEAINKIGSMANGPLLALFLMAALMPSIGSARAGIAFSIGLLCNVSLWYLAPGVSWLWWNVAGCVAGLAAALCFSLAMEIRLDRSQFAAPGSALTTSLLTTFAGIVVLLAVLSTSAR